MVVTSISVFSSLIGILQRLGVHAFNTVLSRKRGLYQEVALELSKRISGSEHTGLKREFGALVRDGLGEFKDIAF